MKHILVIFSLCLAVAVQAAPAAKPAIPAAKPAVPAAKPAAKSAARPAAKPAPAVSAVAPAPAVKGMARIETVVGVVKVEMRPGAKAIPATAGMLVPEGALVTTGANGRVFIRFGTNDLVRLRGDSQIWIAQLKGAKPARTATLVQLVRGRLRAMLNRTGAQKVQDFAIAAGSTVCAVKGTNLSVGFVQAAGAALGASKAEIAKVEVMCESGSVGVGIIPSTADLATLDVAMARTQMLRAGYQVATNPDTGKIDLARRAPVKTTVELVGGTGRVTAVVGGQTITILPGDEIPAGAVVSVTGGSAIIAGANSAMVAGDGTTFAYAAKVEGAVPALTSVVTVTAGSVLMDAGGRSETVGVGMSEVVSGTGVLTQMSPAQAQAVLNPPATIPVTTVTPAPVETTPSEAAEDVLPEMPSLPPGTTGQGEQGQSTPAQDTETVTPPGSGDPLPVSPSVPVSPQ